MSKASKGVVLIDALLSLMIVGLSISLLVSNYVVELKSSRKTQEVITQLREREQHWWLESNGGCRDICLIDEALYP